MTIEALMQRRERGTAALNKLTVWRRLSEVSNDQLSEVGARLRKLKPEIARAWYADEVSSLMLLHERTHALGSVS
jgi:hypothetical protein